MVRHFKLGHLKLASQFTLLLSLIFIGGIALGGFALSQALEQKAEMEISDRGQITMQMVNAVRSYAIRKIVPLMTQRSDSQSFTPETTPSFAARQVFEIFKENWKYQDFMYKDATLNPTNIADQADRFEAKLVEKFASDRTLKSLSGFRSISGEQLFYIAQPLAVTGVNCLKCHSTPEVAPKSHVERYGTQNGYGWKLNQIIGTQIIHVPASEVTSSARKELFLFINIFIGIFALAIVSINYLLKKRVIQPLKPMAQLAQTITKDTISVTEVRALDDSKLTQIYERTDELGQLGRVFQKMVREVYIREQLLAEQLQQLRVEIDQTKVIHQVAEIEESDYFQNLQKSAKEIRNQWREEGVGSRE
jgi:HAMP domain-containing protein